MITTLLAAAAPVTAWSAPTAQVFADARPLDGGVSRPETLIAADLDGDGLADTVYLDTRLGAVQWLRSLDGSGAGPAAATG
ncbi:MAG: hypothetical protein AAGG01_19290, partial [Planctomycetota bacterium]